MGRKTSLTTCAQKLSRFFVKWANESNAGIRLHKFSLVLKRFCCGSQTNCRQSGTWVEHTGSRTSSKKHVAESKVFCLQHYWQTFPNLVISPHFFIGVLNDHSSEPSDVGILSVVRQLHDINLNMPIHSLLILWTMTCAVYTWTHSDITWTLK